MKDEFAGTVAVVTGAAQGIGRAIAEQLHAQGARVLLVDCNAAGVAAVTESIRTQGGAAVDFAVADLADPLAIKSLTAKVAGFEPRVDILVNNAGIEVDTPFESITAELFDRVIAVNLRAPLLVSQALVPLFPRSGGAIVNISSIHAEHAFPNAISLCLLEGGNVGSDTQSGPGTGTSPYPR